MKKMTKDLEVSKNLPIFALDNGRSQSDNPHAHMDINNHF